MSSLDRESSMVLQENKLKVIKAMKQIKVKRRKQVKLALVEMLFVIIKKFSSKSEVYNQVSK